MLKQLTRARLTWLALIILAILLVLYRCTGGADAAPEYQTAPAEKTNVVSRVSTSGSLQAVVTVDVGSQVSGRVQELYADFNSKVRKGEKIAKIDPSLFQAAVVQAEANVMAARANVTRLEVTADDAERQARRASEVFEQRLISETERDNAVATARAARAAVEQAKGQLAQALAQLEQARTNLRYTDILSPTDGVVISRAVNVGQTVAASLQAPVIFTIAQDLRKMEVHTNVAESDIGRLKPGMRVSFTVDAYPGEPFRGSIRDIRNAPQVVQNVVTYDAVIDVNNDDLKLKPGMTATVSVVTDRRSDVLAVPNAALRFRPEGVAAGQGQGQGQRSAQASGGAQSAGGGAGGAGQRGQWSGGQGGQGGDGSWRRDRGGENEEGGPPEPVRRTVYVLQGGQPVPREVTVGITDGRVTEVIDGDLKEGENVIVSIAGQNPNQRGQGQRGFRIL
ncbi:MAG TPA: efflux RND transporter periplasmic adaptor subunit [Steroidobacteraceae bacterium]|nr:efflux RND transporter periplasmic adaptor subunit [Steroidobacteraceae bacterium]